jgi:hypothetical protein
MKLTNLALLSTVVFFGAATVGCTAKSGDTTTGAESLGTSESQLVEDDAESDDTDADAEAGLDEPLSGATPTDPSSPAEGASAEDIAAKVKANAGKFFQPAGCITSELAGNVAKHVFKGCSGPWGLAGFDGEVTSTYSFADGKLTVTHAFAGFKANGASLTGTRVVTYAKEGTKIVRTRTGEWSGTTKKGREITHKASFVATWDPTTKCVERDGAAQTTVGAKSFDRTLTDYKRCGIGKGGCPQSGTLALSRTKSGDSVSLTIEYLGGTAYRVTRPNGTQVERRLVCNANAG